MIDTSRCMAKHDDAPLFSATRCQEPATHQTVMGKRCARHAEELKIALRDPLTVGNVIAGNRARTEEEIDRMVVLLPKGDA